MRKILITGAAGFVGIHLAGELSNKPNTQVILVDLPGVIHSERTELWEELKKKSNVCVLGIDLSDVESVKSLPDVDLVYALAAVNGTIGFYEKPFDVLWNTTISTLNIVNRFKEQNTPIIYTSSSEVYASSVEIGIAKIPTNEDVLISFADNNNPRWSYGMSKAHGEIALNSKLKQFGGQGSIVRLHNVYGPRMGSGHVVWDLTNKIIKKNFEVIGPEEIRSFLHISDAVSGLLHVEKAINEGVSGTFHLGTQEQIKIRELHLKLCGLIGVAQSVVDLPPMRGSVPKRVPDISKSARILNWTPKIALEDGLREFVGWYKSFYN